jgi:hypothetical protein
MLRSRLLGGLLIRATSGVQTPTNTVAPTLSTSTPVIGTAITVTPGTWTGSPTLTYQWQRNTGSWVDIASATSTSYTPVDADWGYALRVVETGTNGAGSAAANSTATGLTRELPSQTLGAELTTDGDMEAVGVAAYTAGSATLTKQTTSPFAGAQVLRVVRNATAARASQSIGALGNYYEFGVVGRSDGTNEPRLATNQTTIITGTTSTNWQTMRTVARAQGTSVDLQSAPTVGNYPEYDNFTVKQLTLNTQLTAPSANMRVTAFYTLPASPATGDVFWLMPRVSNFASGNYWLALLEYTNAGQWNVTLFSVASHARTSRASATNIGSTNGIRVNMNGSSIVMETTANGGSNWTQRGVSVTNSTYSTATGANAMCTSAFTFGQFVYEAAV